MDCVVFEKGESGRFTENWRGYEEALTQQLRTHPADLRLPITDLLERIEPTVAKTARLSGGEVQPGKHGVFVGDYWRQMEELQRLGFLQGFIECQRRDARSTARFSRSDEWYVSEISRFFGIREDEMDTTKEYVPIADAIFRLKDG
jgi:hypothetical protein